MGFMGVLGGLGKGIGKVFGGGKKAGAQTPGGSPEVDTSAQKGKKPKKDKPPQPPMPQKQQLDLGPKFSGRGGAALPVATGQPIPSYKKGGRVKKTGLALLHRGELVVPAKHSRKAAGRKRSIVKL